MKGLKTSFHEVPVEEKMRLFHFGFPADERDLAGIIQKVSNSREENFPRMLIQYQSDQMHNNKEFLALIETEKTVAVVQYFDLHWHYWGSGDPNSWHDRTVISAIWFFHGGLIPCVDFSESPHSRDYHDDYSGSVEVVAGLAGYPLAEVLKIEGCADSIHACRALKPEWQTKRWKDQGGSCISISKIEMQEEKDTLPDKGKKSFLEFSKDDFEKVIQQAMNMDPDDPSCKALAQVLVAIPVNSGQNILPSSRLTFKGTVQAFMEEAKFPQVEGTRMKVDEFVKEFIRRIGEDGNPEPNFRGRVITLPLILNPRGGWYQTGHIFTSFDWESRKWVPHIVVIGDSGSRDHY